MSDFKLLDVVKLRQSLPDEGLSYGQLGTVVFVFSEPHTAYEVEFSDSEGRTIAQLPLRPEQIELYKPNATESQQA